MVGRTLSHYRFLEQIGAGGMGVVYRARDERLERDVAVKVLPAGTLADETARKRFRKEALTLSQLNHPNIAMVFDFDTHEETDFLVMELIPGVTLNDKLAGAALPEKEIGRLGVQMAQGLAAAHEQGIVHRDLKPGNLLVTPDGRLKILDFGLATLRRPETTAASTLTAGEGGVAGTLPYMAPEQLRGEKADARSDIFSAGVVLYEMATGRRPFAQPADTLLNPAPAPSTVNKKVSTALELIILKALDKEPERRYHSARELAVDLERMTAPATVAPAARRRWPLAAAAALALVVAVAALYVFAGREAIESVAILPFVNASGNADAEYLSDGIAEALINSLSRIPGLKVTSRSLTFRYKGKEADLRTVGRDLKVQAVLVGRLVQRGEQLSLSAELVDARDASHIWGEQYNRKMADVLVLQEELAREISEQLRLRLTGEQKKALGKRHTQNPEAHQEYLKGLHFFHKTTAGSIQTAIEHFQKAIAKDPAYALAYAALAVCYASYPISTVPPREVFQKAEATASKALQLDDTLAEAHTALAGYKAFYEWDWAGGEREHRRALELNPSSPIGRYSYSRHLMAVGRSGEAIEEAKRAQELDPVSPLITGLLGLAYKCARRYDEAIEHYRKAIAIEPFTGARSALAGVYVEKFMFKEAIAELQAAAGRTDSAAVEISMLGRAYARAGNRAAALQTIEKMLAERSRLGYYPATRLATVYVPLGDKDRAFEWVAKAIEEREPALFLFKTDPVYDPLRSDPRYAEMLRRMNLAP